MAENVVSASSNGIKANKRSKSLGRQFDAYGCYKTFYKPDGSKSGLHLQISPKEPTEKSMLQPVFFHQMSYFSSCYNQPPCMYNVLLFCTLLV